MEQAGGLAAGSPSRRARPSSTASASAPAPRLNNLLQQRDREAQARLVLVLLREADRFPQRGKARGDVSEVRVHPRERQGRVLVREGSPPPVRSRSLQAGTLLILLRGGRAHLGLARGRTRVVVVVAKTALHALHPGLVREVGLREEVVHQRQLAAPCSGEGAYAMH